LGLGLLLAVDVADRNVPVEEKAREFRSRQTSPTQASAPHHTIVFGAPNRLQSSLAPAGKHL